MSDHRLPLFPPVRDRSCTDRARGGVAWRLGDGGGERGRCASGSPRWGSGDRRGSGYRGLAEPRSVAIEAARDPVPRGAPRCVTRPRRRLRRPREPAPAATSTFSWTSRRDAAASSWLAASASPSRRPRGGGLVDCDRGRPWGRPCATGRSSSRLRTATSGHRLSRPAGASPEPMARPEAVTPLGSPDDARPVGVRRRGAAACRCENVVAERAGWRRLARTDNRRTLVSWRRRPSA